MGPEFENVKESWFLIMLFTYIPKVTRMDTPGKIVRPEFNML